MSLGENMIVTLFGESHGPAVGALIEGMPANVEFDLEQLITAVSYTHLTLPTIYSV